MYFLLNRGPKILYIGSTGSIGARLATHSKQKHFHQVFYVPVGPAILAHAESALIAMHRPPLNRQSDGGYGVKWFPEETLDYIYGELYGGDATGLPPRDVVLARRPTNSTSLHFHLEHPESPQSRLILFQKGVYARQTRDGFGWYDRHSAPTLPPPEDPSGYLPLIWRRPKGSRPCPCGLSGAWCRLSHGNGLTGAAGMTDGMTVAAEAKGVRP